MLVSYVGLVKRGAEQELIYIRASWGCFRKHLPSLHPLICGSMA